ncbi:MAG: hypothetical protein HQL29_03340 [Candidatus Omnitrophica bacterium]|nr:hypothetical protein [Candidatus Omnitrophota bacterium]
MKARIVVAIIMVTLAAHTAWCAETPIRFDFEKDTQGWMIPDWALYQNDVVGESVSISSEHFSSGKSSLALKCAFPGDSWAAAIVEYQEDLKINLEGYKSISVDIYLPEDAPSGEMAAKIILTIDKTDQWIESRDVVRLNIGKWVTVKVPLDMSEKGEMWAWKCNKGEECVIGNLSEIKKIAVRIEYDVSTAKSGPPYNGAVYIDNVVIE